MTASVGVISRAWWLALAALALAAFLLVAGCAGDEAGSPAAPTSDGGDPTASSAGAEIRRRDLPHGEDRVVQRVVDGDTLVVDGGERVRLIGIDTLETKDPRRPVECFGREAAGFAESLLASGTEVRLVFDVEEVDRYDRTLAYVYRLRDGLFVNLELVEEGYAQVFTVPPNVEHADDFRAAARRAREQQRGLWEAC